MSIHPPSRSLVLTDGIWQPLAVSDVSYPAAGNDACLAVEDNSYWFLHRNACIVEVLRRFPPSGPLYDVGGGNGFVSLAMQSAGHDVVLVEPGTGAINRVRRGLTNVIRSTLEDAAFFPESVDAFGVFDVVEHVADDVAFLRTVHDLLKPQGRLYCTVPAISGLWSYEDVEAGHHRRYSQRSLAAVLTAAGFRVEFISSFFSWLVVPLFMFRTLPTLLGRKTAGVAATASMRADHTLPAVLRWPVNAVNRRELHRLARGTRIWFGTSLICVARRP